MALTAEQIAEARSEGYSDAEILDHYAKTSGVDLAAARKEGYSNAEILSHLSGAEVTPEPEVVEGRSAISSPELSGALGAGAGAVYSAKTLPVKAAKAFGSTIMNRLPTQGGVADDTAAMQRYLNSQIALKGVKGNVPLDKFASAMNLPSDTITQSQIQNALEEIKGSPAQRTPIQTPTGGRIYKNIPAKDPINLANLVEQPVSKSKLSGVGNAVRGVATSNPVAGAMAGYNLQDAMNRYREGDITGATIGGAGTAASLLPKMKGKMGLIKPVVGAGAALVNKLRGEPESVMNKANGGVVAPHLEHMAKGGAVQHFSGGKRALAEEAIKGVKSLFTPRETKIIRASEALAPHEGKYLNVTQSDRMRSTGGDLGGPGFSRFQTIDPAYEGAAWGVGKKPTASAIVNYNKRFPEGQAIWSPMIGSETQHHSNQHVFDTLAEEFNRNVRLGKLTPELRQRANERLQKYGEYAGRFDPKFDIANPEMLADAAKTFDRRGALAEVMSGKGVGGQKGSIIDYPAIMQEMTDPMTIGAPTHSIGTRLFNLTGEVEHRPDLHSAFPYILKGQDQAVAFNPIPKELALRDWMQNFRDFKGRSPGYYDMTRTIPSQQITEDYLRSLEAAGHAEGGRAKVNKLKGGLGMLPMAQRTDMRQTGRAIDEFAGADAYNKAKMLYNSPAGQTIRAIAPMVNPYAALGIGGGTLLRGMSEGDTDTMVEGGLGMLGMAPHIGKGIRAAKSFGDALMQNPRAPSMMDRLYQNGAPDERMVPAMAGGGDVVKSLIKKTLGAVDNVGSRTIEGSPHTYPPIAEGPWMRDYQPSAPAVNAAGLPTTREGWDALGEQSRMAQIRAEQELGRTGPERPSAIQYMGKYRRGTPEERAAQQQEELATIRMLKKLRGME